MVSIGNSISELGQPSLAQQLANLERRIKDLETATPLSHASISSGGVTIRDGGELRVVGPDGEGGEETRLLVTDGEIVVQAGGRIRSEDYVEDGEVGYLLGEEIVANLITLREGIIAPEALAQRTYVNVATMVQADSETSNTINPQPEATLTVPIPSWVTNAVMIVTVDAQAGWPFSSGQRIASLKCWLPDWHGLEDLLGIAQLAVNDSSPSVYDQHTLSRPVALPGPVVTSMPTSLDVRVSLTNPVGTTFDFWEWTLTCTTIGTS